ncbi:MAG: MerR family transcriptional regulator [Nitrospinales bacterium]
MGTMTISKVAKKAGVGVETVRFYERKGLVQQPPKPSGGGYRIYPEEAVERIRFIRQAQELGFSLREIEELLSLRTDPATHCADVRERAQAKLDEVRRKVAQLNRIQAALEQLIAACPGRGALQLCSIIEAIEAPGITKLNPKKNKAKKR